MSTETVAAMLGAGPHALALEEACIRFGIESTLAKAHFLAQVAHESGGFRHTREIWGPTPAQARYEGRRDLGNTVKGDGFRFRGRGLIQVTGRANYRAYSQAIYGDDRCVLAPEMLEVAPDAAMCAGWYWQANRIGPWAEKDDALAVSRAINCGNPMSHARPNGFADRVQWLNKAKAAFAEIGLDFSNVVGGSDTVPGVRDV